MRSKLKLFLVMSLSVVAIHPAHAWRSTGSPGFQTQEECESARKYAQNGFESSLSMIKLERDAMRDGYSYFGRSNLVNDFLKLDSQDRVAAGKLMELMVSAVAPPSPSASLHNLVNDDKVKIRTNVNQQRRNEELLALVRLMENYPDQATRFLPELAKVARYDASTYNRAIALLAYGSLSRDRNASLALAKDIEKHDGDLVFDGKYDPQKKSLEYRFVSSLNAAGERRYHFSNWEDTFDATARDMPAIARAKRAQVQARLNRLSASDREKFGRALEWNIGNLTGAVNGYAMSFETYANGVTASNSAEMKKIAAGLGAQLAAGPLPSFTALFNATSFSPQLSRVSREMANGKLPDPSVAAGTFHCGNYPSGNAPVASAPAQSAGEQAGTASSGQ